MTTPEPEEPAMNDDFARPPADSLVPDLDADGYPWDIDEDGYHWGTTSGTPYAFEHQPIYPVRYPDLYQQPDWLPDLNGRTADAAADHLQSRHPTWDALPDMEAGQ
jgi:hypothetical protein